MKKMIKECDEALKRIDTFQEIKMSLIDKSYKRQLCQVCQKDSEEIKELFDLPGGDAGDYDISICEVCAGKRGLKKYWEKQNEIETTTESKSN